MSINFENNYLIYRIHSNGNNASFIDKTTGIDYCALYLASACARVVVAGQSFGASSAEYAGGTLTLQFGASGLCAKIAVKLARSHLVFHVLSLGPCTAELPAAPADVQVFTFVNIDLTLHGSPEEPFAACALALNLQTNVAEMPQPTSRLEAICYPRFGFAGAQAAIIGCPQPVLRSVMQEAVSAATELPHSPLGGPWALDAPSTRGSYMFNFGDMSEAKVDSWIALAKKLGINQIDFHGGRSFRFGDCFPNPETYPNGIASFKAVIDKLHAASILAGLHTYAFFIDKTCPWVTPVPDPRLAKDATLTLAQPLSADDAAVPVEESTELMSTITGFFVRNSVTLQIDDELIIYKLISKEPPYAFTDCQRGAYGTRAVSHSAGAKVGHLKECFGLFVPDGDSDMLAEVAASAAHMYNACGFDMMYLDALDGEDILGGAENSWHYGSKFVFELWKRLNKPAIMEMSTFHHHLWYVRSRIGAWDHPNRSHKRFIDMHCETNTANGRMFLPGHLGWWAVKTWINPQGEPTFADDIEYLCGKCIGNGVGFSIMGIEPDNIGSIPVYERLAAIMRHYEELRHADYFPEHIKAQLRVPGSEFTLIRDAGGDWRLKPVQYTRYKAEISGGESHHTTVINKFGRQALGLRIEAFMTAEPYTSPKALTLLDLAVPGEITDRQAAQGVSLEVLPREAAYKAANTNAPKDGAWTKVEKHLAQVDLTRHQALGVWIEGDGKGEVLNVQLRSPEHISGGIGEHYVTVDFTGWRYFTLIEPEGERYSYYTWPYGTQYTIYRENVDYSHVESISLWYNNIPAGKQVTCRIKPLVALPLVAGKLVNPRVAVGGKTLRFPVEIESGCYLEFNALDDCKLYGPKGELLREVAPQGELPLLAEGENQIEFMVDGDGRANVTVISKGALCQPSHPTNSAINGSTTKGKSAQ